ILSMAVAARAEPASLDQLFDDDSLYLVRAAVAAHASEAGLPGGRVRAVVLGVHALAATAVRHGAGQGRVRPWIPGAGIRCGGASSLAKKCMKPSGSGPVFMATRWSKPASTYCWATCTCRLTSGPQANCSLTSSGPMLATAAWKFTGLGNSAMTFHPVSENVL